MQHQFKNLIKIHNKKINAQLYTFSDFSFNCSTLASSVIGCCYKLVLFIYTTRYSTQAWTMES